ncbi:ATP-binding protein [Neobacillus sp. SM06]|uniref:ATP-binding protein n=1 Tax=Neobacillus sp. SM06 TaxID=3422492 RepID=UPI003D2BF2C5
MTTELLRIEAIANDLLYFSKPHKINKKLINLVPLVKEVIYLFESLAFKRHISINFSCDNEYIAIECDEVQIKQALINFIKNAIEATSTNGEVTIKMEKDCNHNIAKISVSDTGCGMTGDEIQKLGTSFFTTKEDGTGLGIFVTYTIIKNHNGTIEVKSEKGQGTTFTITLPFVSQ